jgi:Tfp pilus assembly protein PilO
MAKDYDLDDAAEFVGQMLHSSTVTHFMHLSTDSYAEHVALGAYYEQIIELTDDFAEAYQGRYEKIKDYPTEFHNATDPKKYLESMQKFVDESRQELPQESEIQNIIDEISQLIDSTLYKLKFLS